MAQVPAVVADRIHQGALVNAGCQHKQTTSNNNVARNAYRSMKRTGIGWRIPIDSTDYQKEDKTFLLVHFLRPTKIVEYFTNSCPTVLCGGKDALEMETLCESFWKAYQVHHPTHEVFATHNGNLRRVIPLAFHGDEGKGKRRSSTTVTSLEAVIGCKGGPCCNTCEPSFLNLPDNSGDAEHDVAKQMNSNMKGHSYLQHWPLFVIPGTLAKDYKPLTNHLLDIIAADLVNLFNNGVNSNGTQWYGAIIGAKGDLKWQSKIGRFTRGFEHKGHKQDLPCCHCCLGGSPGIPAEDITSEHPCWERTMWASRPWAMNNQPSLSVVPYDRTRPEQIYQHDPFHTLRLGIFRDFVGSVVFLYLVWGYFGDGAVPVKLESAYSSFKLWCLTVQKSASLRSFSKALFNYKTKRSYPWINAKGADVVLAIKWIKTITCGFIIQCTDQEEMSVLNAILNCATVAIQFGDHMYHHKLWLNSCCAASLYENGHAFLVGYTWLAGYAFNAQLCLFSIKPKAHFYKHILLVLFAQLESGAKVHLNPMCWDCSQNEDFIGRMSALTTKLDSRVATKRVLEFWMVKASILFKRHFPKMKQ